MRSQDGLALERPPPPLAAGQMLSLPPVTHVPTWAYLACFIGCVVASALMLVVAPYRLVPTPLLQALVRLCPVLCILGAIIAWFVLLHKAWAAIQDGEARTTPAAAVLGCIIPVYNIYGLFQATVGFAQDFNRLAQRERIEGGRARVTLYGVWCACLLLAPVPVVAEALLQGILRVYLGSGAIPLWSLALSVSAAMGLIVPVTTPLVIVDMCNAINAIADAQAPGGSPR
jgi:hypothetical protein